GGPCGAPGPGPPHPTWPAGPEASDRAPGFTARQLLIAIDKHVRGCLLSGEARELTSLTAQPYPPAGEGRREPAAGTPERTAAEPTAAAHAAPQARFATLRVARTVPPTQH